MKTVFFCICVCMAWSCSPKISTVNKVNYGIESTDSRGNPMLLGTWAKDAMQKEPYNSWFTKNYNEYKIDSLTAGLLKPLLKNKKVEIFLGTWCGDSKREVPRWLKLLDYCGVNKNNIQLIFVNNHDSAYKQSPYHEEKGKYIFRVPDLLVYENEKEIGRIIESPVISAEKDLLQITREKNYMPNYKAAFILTGLLKSNTIAGDEKDIANIVTQLKPFTTYSGELNSFGRILLNEAEYKKAIITFKVNTALFPEDVTAKEKLATALWKANDLAAAEKCCKEILAMHPNNTTASTILKTIK
jgi:tetratricopeptide (TPR) repeat protein